MNPIASLLRAGGEAVLRGVLSAWQGPFNPSSTLAMSTARGILGAKLSQFSAIPVSEADRFIRNVYSSMQRAAEIGRGGNPGQVPALPGSTGPYTGHTTTYVARVDMGDGGPPVEVVGVLDTPGVPTIQQIRQDAADALTNNRFRDTPRGGNRAAVQALNDTESVPTLLQVRVLSIYQVP